MKPPKRQQIPPPAGHLGPGKDRALSNALLRVSEKTVNQERKEVDDIVYCGDEEPFDGWTNAVPHPRYSGGKRPKQTHSKRKKMNKKLKKDSRSDNGDIMWGMTGITLDAVDQQNAFATLRDMYDNYKKKKEVGGLSKKNGIIDPETYEYVPWEERDVGEDGNKLKLPPINGAPSSRLADVLEKYMSKRKDSFGSKRFNVDDAANSVGAAEMMAYYDRYKWNFAEENKQKNVEIISENKRKVESIRLPTVTTTKKNNNNIEPNVKEKLVRYVNGAVHKKRHNRSLYKEGNNAFYIKIHGGESSPTLPSMVKLEKKRETYGGESTDRWVARVIIKQPNESGSNWFKPYKDTDSNSSVIIVPDTRWKRKLGVVEGERERIQREMEKLRFQQSQQIKLYQMKKKLLRDNYDVDDHRYRLKQRNGTQRQAPPMFSLAEAAKVSMKRGGERSKSKKPSQDPPTVYPSTTSLPHVVGPTLKPIERDPPEGSSNPINSFGEPSVTQMLPSRDQISESKNKTREHSRSKRLFLKRGAAQKSENRVASQRADVRLPVLPKQAKMVKEKRKRDDSIEEDAQDASTSADEEVDKNESKTRVPLAHKASKTFKVALSGSTEVSDNRTHDPASSNEEDMQKQVAKSSQLLEKKSQKSQEFVRYKVIPQPGYKTHSKVGSSTDHKPIHPPHTKNKGQEKIQGMVGQEKGAITSVIDHLNSKLGRNYNSQEPADGTNLRTALSNAFASAKLMEEQKQNQVPANLVNGAGRGNVVMKRRVVPPILSTPSVTQPEPDPDNLPILTNRSTSNGDEEVNQEDAIITSQSDERKSNKRIKTRALKKTSKLKSRSPKRANETAMFDDVILSGDVIVHQRPTPKLLEHSFAASISSVKPSRRVVNIVPQRVVQKG